LSRKPKSITVLGSLYDEYLAKGGTTKSLLGNLLAESNKKSLPDMITGIYDDTSNYETIVRLRNSRSNKSRAATMRTIAYNTLVSFTTTSSLTELERDYCGNNLEEFRKQVIERAKVVKSELTDSDTMDVNTVALKMITKSRFFFTDAENYLTSMVDIKRADPDLTIDEVRFLATSQYVARFLATQIDYETIY